MSVVIGSLMGLEEEKFARSTRYRFGLMFQPIQKVEVNIGDGIKHRHKNPDFTAFLARPIMDVAFAPLFVVDVAIHLLNAVVSLAQGLHLWSMEQGSSGSLMEDCFAGPEKSTKQFLDASMNFQSSLSAILAVFNVVPSVLSLVTRPMMSVAKAVSYFRRARSEYEPIELYAELDDHERNITLDWLPQRSVKPAAAVVSNSISARRSEETEPTTSDTSEDALDTEFTLLYTDESNQTTCTIL